jgi:TolB protein
MNSSKNAQPRRLTTDGRRKIAPVFVGKEEIVFAAHEASNLVALKRLKLKNGSQTRVHPQLTAHQFDPAFSSDGRFHAFALSANSPQLVLVIQDSKEKIESAFRPREARAVVRSPSFAPDNRKVVFSLSDVNGHMIASVDTKGNDLTPLAASSGMNTSPAFSPDGAHIAFASSRSGNYEIYLMNADGTDVRRLTHSSRLNVRPSWSPDGRRIAFTSNRDSNYEIYLMNSNGTGLRRITSNSATDDYATWHPDGTALLMVSDRDGRSDLYLVEI